VSVRIDLHLHTTVSDGRSSPEALVTEAAHAGLAVIAVTERGVVVYTFHDAKHLGGKGDAKGVLDA